MLRAWRSQRFIGKRYHVSEKRETAVSAAYKVSSFFRGLGRSHSFGIRYCWIDFWVEQQGAEPAVIETAASQWYLHGNQGDTDLQNGGRGTVFEINRNTVEFPGQHYSCTWKSFPEPHIILCTLNGAWGVQVNVYFCGQFIGVTSRSQVDFFPAFWPNFIHHRILLKMIDHSLKIIPPARSAFHFPRGIIIGGFAKSYCSSQTSIGSFRRRLEVSSPIHRSENTNARLQTVSFPGLGLALWFTCCCQNLQHIATATTCGQNLCLHFHAVI